MQKRKYIGQFENNSRDGKGIFYFNDGEMYEGDFKNDKAEKKGIWYWNNGDRNMRDYLKDEPIGIYDILLYNGKVESGYY